MATKSVSLTRRFSAVIANVTKPQPLQRFPDHWEKPRKRFTDEEPSAIASLKRGEREHMNNGTLVRLIDVHKVYRTGEMDVPAVRGVSLEIKRGEFVALMGASGSGKSTLMNILGCLDRPTSGHYFLDRADVSGLNRDQLADIRNRKIGFVFQNFNLLPRTSARENAELPLVYSTQRLSHVQLREKADRVLASVGTRWARGSSSQPALRRPATTCRNCARTN